MCRGCSGFASTHPELFGSCDLPEATCPYCGGSGDACRHDEVEDAELHDRDGSELSVTATCKSCRQQVETVIMGGWS